MAVQPLDLLPPADVTFEDYALAMLRAEQIANPTDPDGYRNMMIDVFVGRGILSDAQATELKKPVTVFDRLDVAVFHDPQSILASRANAYRFLDDNRRRPLHSVRRGCRRHRPVDGAEVHSRGSPVAEANSPPVYLARGREA